jgi:hypothetical protein
MFSEILKQVRAHVFCLLHFPRTASTTGNPVVQQPDEKEKDADGRSETQDANFLEFRESILWDQMALD